jgi:hypothetical protein
MPWSVRRLGDLPASIRFLVQREMTVYALLNTCSPRMKQQLFSGFCTDRISHLTGSYIF